MSKVAVIYWSGTGNTEAMARAVVEGVQGAGAEADLFAVHEITAADAAKYDRLALGCRPWAMRCWKKWSLSHFSPS